MRKTRKYTNEEKQQIMEEAKNVGNILAVAKKNGIPAATLHTWLKPKNIKSKDLNNVELKELKSKLASADLENKILKELLKKTYLVWNSD